MANEPILVVDDDDDIRELFQLVLEDEGYDVETASTAQQALEKAKNKTFYVALLDIVLPDIRGDELAVELKTVDPSIEIVFITGFSNFKDTINALGLGACDILLKPVTGKQLLEATKEALLLHSKTKN